MDVIGHDHEFVEKEFPLIAIMRESFDQEMGRCLASEDWLAMGGDGRNEEDAVGVHSAMVVPMGVRTDGLPVAVQLVGPPGSELRLLAVAGQLEEASPWLRHAPGWPLRNNEPG